MHENYNIVSVEIERGRDKRGIHSFIAFPSLSHLNVSCCSRYFLISTALNIPQESEDDDDDDDDFVLLLMCTKIHPLALFALD